MYTWLRVTDGILKEDQVIGSLLDSPKIISRTVSLLVVTLGGPRHSGPSVQVR